MYDQHDVETLERQFNAAMEEADTGSALDAVRRIYDEFDRGGEGLTALLPNRTDPAPQTDTGSPTLIRIDDVEPNPVQPRRVFEPDRLKELATSIQALGIIQPIVVRPSGGRYQLVAGERRWRAAKLAGLETIPVIVKDIPDERLLEITLVEKTKVEV